MRVGVPSEVKNHEYRVAITPAGVHELVLHGHEVFVEHGAGVGSSIPNEQYVEAGATLLDDPDAVWETAEMVLKVKEPVKEEYSRMREMCSHAWSDRMATRSCRSARSSSFSSSSCTRNGSPGAAASTRTYGRQTRLRASSSFISSASHRSRCILRSRWTHCRRDHSAAQHMDTKRRYENCPLAGFHTVRLGGAMRFNASTVQREQVGSDI